MNQNRDIKWFLILECVIYIVFTTIDVCSNNPTWIHISVALKLISIGLCLVFLGQMAYANPDNRDGRLMVLIMSLTLASDVFLLLTRQFTYGLILFVCVQLLYSIRIQKRVNLKSLLIKGILFIVSLYFFMKQMPQQHSYALMLSLGAFYALLFAWNLILLTCEIWTTTRTASESSTVLHLTRVANDHNTVYDSRLFIIGLVLYALCDLNVAIYNFPSFFDSNVMMLWLYKNSNIAMWLFYLPGQVALTLSVRLKVDVKSG